MALQSRTPGTKSRRRIDSSHYLYIAVIGAVLAGITVGLAAPEFAVGLKPIGDAFVLLIKMMIAPIIFCTIVLGVGSIAKAATVGKVGGLALLYFIVMSTFALGIGLVVGNLIHPGEGLDIADSTYDAVTTEANRAPASSAGIGSSAGTSRSSTHRSEVRSCGPSIAGNVREGRFHPWVERVRPSG